MKTLWDYQDEQDGVSRLGTEPDTKDEQIARKRDRLLERVHSSNVARHIDKVAWILCHFPIARESDVELQILYWRHFEGFTSGDSVTLKEYRNLTRLTSIVRARAIVQNDLRLFVASHETRQRRGTLADDQRSAIVQVGAAVAPVCTVLMDESGKQAGSRAVIVASMWILEPSVNLLLAVTVRRLQERMGSKGEFHFKEVKDDNESVYRDLIDTLASQSNAVSFKVMSVNRAGIRNIGDALYQLTLRLLVKGVEHEHDSGRMPLPREIQVRKDAEEPGSDRVFLDKLSEDLRRHSHSSFHDKLTVGECKAVSSHTDWGVQVADLFSGSMNRIINGGSSGAPSTAKDRIANRFLGVIGVKRVEDFQVATENDMVVSFHL